MQNLEIKAKYEDHKKLQKLLKQVGAHLVMRSRQVDTYFAVPHGRLKLREYGAASAELVFYERGERSIRRWSDYYVYHCENPLGMKAFLKKVFSVLVVVDKQRILYRYKNVKIHVDRVRRLGNFMEIEVEVTKGRKQARQLLETLLRLLQIPKKDFIKQSYSDLLMLR